MVIKAGVVKPKTYQIRQNVAREQEVTRCIKPLRYDCNRGVKTAYYAAHPPAQSTVYSP